MKIPVETWSYENEEKYKRLLVSKRLREEITPDDKKWIKDNKTARQDLIDARTRRMPTRPITERLHYRWIKFYYKTMRMAVAKDLKGRGPRAAWLILLETELMALNDWKPALTRAHTLRRHGFLALRAEFVMRAEHTKDSTPLIINKEVSLDKLPRDEQKWELLWTEKKNRCADMFPILSADSVQAFRKEVIKETYELTYYCYPAFKEEDLQRENPD